MGSSVIGQSRIFVNRRFPWRTRWTVVLLGVAVASAAFRLADIAVGVDTSLARTFLLIAIALGWLMAARKMRGWLAVLVSILAGAVVLTVRIGQLGAQLIAVPLELLRWLYHSIQLQENAPADEILATVTGLATDLGVFYTRLWVWLRSLASDQWGVDPVASAFLWSALIWLASIWAAWAVRRRNRPIAAVIPMIAILGVSYVVSQGQPTAFVIPLWATLLLLAFANHDARVRRWEGAGIDSPEGKTLSLAIIVIPIAILLSVAAAWIQSLSVGRIVHVVESIAGGRGRVEGDLADTLGLDGAGADETGLEPLFAPGLPNRHLIGSGPELSEQVALEIVVTNLPVDGALPNLRWRSITYDQYLGRGWRTSNLRLTDHQDGVPIREPVKPTDRVVRQAVREVKDRGGRVYSAGLPAVFDQQVQIAWRRVGDDLFAITADARPYQVESIVSRATQSDLRTTGTDYPDWVRETYLTLPGDVPARVMSLARDLTATAPTPYDRALAIESYLRAFPYNLDVSGPPPGRDVVDYFLFDLEQGYCDYFASSMVVLARAAGLPARLVVGYATGAAERTEGTIRYTVTEAEAHSWVEIYFPEFGWIEFEPTSGRAAIVRTEEGAATVESDLQDLELAGRPAFAVELETPVLLAVAGSIAGWAIWVLLVDPLRLSRQPARVALATLYRRLRRHARQLGVVIDAGDTPREFQSNFAGSQVGHLAEPVGAFMEAYAATAYTRRPLSAAEGSRIIRSWPKLSARLWVERVRRILRIP